MFAPTEALGSAMANKKKKKIAEESKVMDSMAVQKPSKPVTTVQ